MFLVKLRKMFYALISWCVKKLHETSSEPVKFNVGTAWSSLRHNV